MKRTLFAALAASTILAIPATVWAAAQPPCTPASMTPSAATSVPANLPGFGYNATAATANDVHLFATSPGPRTEVPVTLGPVEGGLLKVKPMALTAGTSYQLEYSAFCSYGGYPSKPLTFVAAAEAPLPTKLGETTGVPVVVLKDYGTTQYTITATYSVAAEMKPWSGVYQVGIALDGKLVDTKPTFDTARDTVQVVATGWCTEANAQTKKHTIGLRGTLPFAPTVETTSTDVEFDCPAPKFSTLPSNPPVQPVPGGTTPGGTTGSGASNDDGGHREASGCSVGSTSTASSPLPSAAFFFGAIFAVIALIRRVNRDAAAAWRRK